MRETPLVGGWVEALQSQVQKLPDDTVQLNSIKLSTNRTRRGKEHHLYVSQERSVDAIINEISTSLVEFLNQRFSVDKEMLDTIKPFVQLQPSANIPKIHNLLGTDLDLATLWHLSMKKFCRQMTSIPYASCLLLVLCLASRPHPSRMCLSYWHVFLRQNLALQMWNS